MRDYQRSLVYNWEATVIQQFAGPPVLYRNVKTIVEHVWASEGLLYPPRVELLQPNVKTFGADATRDAVRFPMETNTRVILHELAHAMTSISDGGSEMHGPAFVGMVMQLYHRYMGVDLLMMEHTATMMGVEFTRNQRPVFLDK